MQRTILFWVLAAFILGGFYFAGRLGVHAHRDTSEMDTGAYLEAALDIRKTGGAGHFLKNCWDGVYREATQHPLYLLVLSVEARRDTKFFVESKVRTYWIGFFFLLLLILLILERFGHEIALLASCFVLTSATFIHMTTMVACESLLALCFLGFWFFTLKGFEKNKYWLLAGVMAGLTFMTKSIGILLLPVFFITVLVTQPKFLKNKFFLGFFVLFFLVASPLLIRNYKVFGAPFYSNSSAVLWIDEWNDYFVSEEKRQQLTLFSYLKTHSPAQISKTFLEGWSDRIPKMLMDGLKPLPFWDAAFPLKALQGYHEKTISWQTGWSSVVIGLAFFGMWIRRRKPDFNLSLIFLLVLFAFVGWFSKIFSGTPPTRLLYPALFVFYAYAAISFAAILKKRKIIYSCIGIFLIFYYAGILHKTESRNPDFSRSYEFPRVFAIQAIWARDHLAPGEKLAVNSVFTGNLFYIREGLRGEIIQWPAVKNFNEVLEFVRNEQLNYAFLDLSTVLYNYGAFKDFFRVAPNRALVQIRELPEPFKKIQRAAHEPPVYELFKTS